MFLNPDLIRNYAYCAEIDLSKLDGCVSLAINSCINDLLLVLILPLLCSDLVFTVGMVMNIHYYFEICLMSDFFICCLYFGFVNMYDIIVWLYLSFIAM